MIYANCLMGLSHALDLVKGAGHFWPTIDHQDALDNPANEHCQCGDYFCGPNQHWHPYFGGCHSQVDCHE